MNQTNGNGMEIEKVPLARPVSVLKYMEQIGDVSPQTVITASTIQKFINLNEARKFNILLATNKHKNFREVLRKNGGVLGKYNTLLEKNTNEIITNQNLRQQLLNVYQYVKNSSNVPNVNNKIEYIHLLAKSLSEQNLPTFLRKLNAQNNFSTMILNPEEMNESSDPMEEEVAGESGGPSGDTGMPESGPPVPPTPAR